MNLTATIHNPKVTKLKKNPGAMTPKTILFHRNNIDFSVTKFSVVIFIIISQLAYKISNSVHEDLAIMKWRRISHKARLELMKGRLHSFDISYNGPNRPQHII